MSNLSHYGSAAQDAAMNAIGPLANSGYLDIYDGAMPATPATAISGQTLLASVVLPATAFGSSSAGVITANAITNVTAGATSTAAWARMYKSDHTTVLADMNVAVSGACLTFNSVSFVSGGTVSISSFTIAAAMIGA